jgi:hypothetical protein
VGLRILRNKRKMRINPTYDPAGRVGKSWVVATMPITTSAASTKTLRVTPAIEAGLTDHVWTLQELVSILEHKEIMSAA